jgi:hypothetical protein
VHRLESRARADVICGHVKRFRAFSFKMLKPVDDSVSRTREWVFAVGIRHDNALGAAFAWNFCYESIRIFAQNARRRT